MELGKVNAYVAAKAGGDRKLEIEQQMGNQRE